MTMMRFQWKLDDDDCDDSWCWADSDDVDDDDENAYNDDDDWTAERRMKTNERRVKTYDKNNDDDNDHGIAIFPCIYVTVICAFHTPKENIRLFDNMVSTVAVCFTQDHIDSTIAKCQQSLFASFACVTPVVHSKVSTIAVCFIII